MCDQTLALLAPRTQHRLCWHLIELDARVALSILLTTQDNFLPVLLVTTLEQS
jgi:hypothetical protein